ncbi:MAG TPA: peroxiredoxin [Burkholderiales bacterium]|nr:peroxiredoxin [Burkholderiales bacterium]
MTVRVGERLPGGTLMEMNEVDAPGCPVGPVSLKVEDMVNGRRIVIFGLPGAFTPTCSAKHVPGYLACYDRLRARGVDEIWCLSVNDAYVMAAWGKDQKTAGKLRMLADGNADYARALGLDLDLSARGLGVRSQRFSMLVEDGVVKILNLEQPGKFEVSGAENMLQQLGG